MPIRPTLSVLMSNYNHAQFLPQSLSAVVEQSYHPDEFIIIDDASTDSSVEIIEAFVRKYSFIRLIRNEQNMGAFVNFNRLLDLSSSEYICCVAADDRMLPGFLEKSMNLLTQYPQAGLCSGISLKIDENGNHIGSIPTAVISNKSIYLPSEKVPRYLDSYGSWINGNTTIYRRDCVLEFGGFRPELLSYCDGFLQLIIALKYGACFVPEPLSSWRESQTGISLDTAGSVKKTRFVINNTIDLMRSDTMSEFFSETFIDKWKKRRCFWIGDTLAKRIKCHHQQVFDEIDKLYVDKTILDRTFKLLSSFLNDVESKLIFSYFVIKNYHAAFFNVFVNRIIFNLKNRLRTVIRFCNRAIR